MNTQSKYHELKLALKPESLRAEAELTAGLSDYGDTRFFAAMEKLVDCIARDCNLHKQGLNFFRNEVIRVLVNRLRFQRDLVEHPEILDENVSDPIVIIGLPRSGTTKTQRMVAADSSLLKTHTWQLLNPAPFPGEQPHKPTQRLVAAADGDSIAEGEVEVQAAHHMAADNVEEDWMLAELTFNDWALNQRNPSKSFREWLTTRTEPSTLDNYRYMKSLFQYLQWQQGGRKGRRWLMKSCGHLANLKELLTVYPRATLVHLHRHPANSAPSYAKILYDVASLRVADLDPLDVGRYVVEWQQASLQRYITFRDEHNLGDQIIDVQYRQMRENPLPVIREIYQKAGHLLTTEAEMAMTHWEQSNEQHQFGKHHYSLEQFGMSDELIERVYGDYINRYIK